MSLPGLSVTGRVALVTGTGSGLGRAIAIGLAQAGADVAATELPDRLEAAEATVREIERHGRRGCVVPLDVTHLPAIGDAVDAAIARLGRLDLLVNNAGLAIRRPSLEVTEADWDRVMTTNLKGAFFVMQAAARRAFVPQGHGKIVNIASIMGVVGYRDRAAYCASKAGLVNLTRALAFEWAPLSINVNAVAPAFIDTPLTRPMFDANPEIHRDIIGRTPLGRLGTPEDVVGAVVYLSSPAADLVTGHTLLVDGGWTAV